MVSWQLIWSNFSLLHPCNKFFSLNITKPDTVFHNSQFSTHGEKILQWFNVTGRQMVKGILLNLLLIQGQRSTLRIIVPVPKFSHAQMAEHWLPGGEGMEDLIAAPPLHYVEATAKKKKKKLRILNTQWGYQTLFKPYFWSFFT